MEVEVEAVCVPRDEKHEMWARVVKGNFKAAAACLRGSGSQT